MCQMNRKLTNESKFQITLGHPRHSCQEEEHLAGSVLRKLTLIR